jgi:hypothetical protein
MSEKNENDRKRLIEELVETKAHGEPAGICGREHCERCGQLGNFSGFCGALGSHLDYNRFTCWQCKTEGSGPGLDQLILERGFRYCGGCGREVILQERTIEETRKLPYTCPPCHGLDRGKAARRRYLEHQATKPGGLDRAAARIRWAKTGIEEILDDSEDAKM